MFERVGEAEKNLPYFISGEGGGGHLSYLDAGGITRGTQLMNMFVVTKFVINDCCLGSITSFFAPSRLFYYFYCYLYMYMYIYSFFLPLKREGMQLCKQLFCFVKLFVWRDFVTWQKREVCFCFMMSLVTSRSGGLFMQPYKIISCRRQCIVKRKSQEKFIFRCRWPNLVTHLHDIVAVRN